MNTSYLRRSWLALSVAAAVTHAPSSIAADLNYDLGGGTLSSTLQTFDKVLLSGTSQNTGADFRGLTVQGGFINEGAINLSSGSTLAGLLFSSQASTAATASTFTGDFINRGSIKIEGLDESVIPAGILHASSRIGGNLTNEGHISVAGTGAVGVDLYQSTIAGQLLNRGTIAVEGTDAYGLLAFSSRTVIDNSGTITARGQGSKGLEIENALSSRLDNSGTISADGIGVHLISFASGNPLFSITQTAGLIEGTTAAIQADQKNAYFYWHGGAVKGDLLGLSGVLVRNDVAFDGSTIRAGYVDIDGGRLTLLRPQTTLDGELDLDSSSAILRLLLDNSTHPTTPILKVTGLTYFSEGSQIELAARSNDFRTSADGTRYTLINSASWENPENVNVVSSSALLEVKSFGIEGNDLKALVSTKNAAVVEENIIKADGSQNAANAIKPLSSTLMARLDERDPVFRSFAGAASDTELARLSEALSPDVSRGVIQAATNGQTLVNSVINNRSSSARNGLSSGDALAEKGVWLQALSSDADQDRRKGVDGYDANSHGIAVGADGKLNADTTLGLAYSYLDTDVKSSSGNKTDVSGHALTLYGDWTHDNFFVDASLMYGWNDNESKRYVAGTRAKGDYDSEMFGVNALAGYTLHLARNVLLEPQIGARYANVAIDAYREKGSSAALNVASQRYEVGEMGVGARLAAAFDLGQGSLEPEARVMAWHDFIGDRSGTTSTFVLGGTPFTTSGASPVRDSYETSLGATYRVGAWSVGGSYAYVTRTDFSADTFTAKVRYDF
ncbi:autotransporter domain-containing protein [Pseudomonas chlororaphis]|uniref:Autotransporter outer membrane beta-barrel domain-containing protein n=1 Tax=Pseudomonas chlororaphis TaxID=587753 RepID=A0A1Q8EV85_9PSED|nr:autotransporter domain-containing protein [Pseudomonas chlororaphis]OLF55715.1 autotransporter outer membrane beta-barrel domain-containing protein [Pseudomonas chlororaphis]